MWSKADFYSAVAKETLEGLTASWQEWAKFLATASRLYKYPFMDQMMIYAQGRMPPPAQNTIYGMTR